MEGPSPVAPPHRAFSSHQLQQLEMAAALEGGRSSDKLAGLGGGRGGAGDHLGGPSLGQAAAAAARVHGLRDDLPPQ